MTDRTERHRYEVREKGVLAGYSRYRDEDGRRIFLHTEIKPDFEGHGLGQVLAQEALADARAKGLEIEAECPFIAAYIRDHPEAVA